MTAWTDYPLVTLGDLPERPVRECRILSYDGDKYCEVEIDGIRVTIKAGYLYTAPDRFGEVPAVSRADLLRLRY